MGIAYHLDKERGVTFTVWDGVITMPDWLDHIGRVTADPAWPAGGLWLADTSSVSDVSSIREADIESAADRYCEYREKLQRSRVAIVAQEVFRKARLFERYLSLCGPNVIVFNELGAASAWLGIDVGIARTVTARLRAGLSGRP